jgi:outer membrane protein TolC
MRSILLPLSLLMASAALLPAQQAPLDLGALQRAAVARDARAAQRALLERATDLRVQGVRDALKPQFSLSAQNTHQSDVTYLPIKLPTVAVPIPPKDRWASALDVTQVLYDGGATSHRAAIERARLAESEAGVDAAIEPLRDEVARTYFSVILLRATEQQLGYVASDLSAMLADTRARVREGAALGRDSAAVRAALIGAQSQAAEAHARQRAAAANLERLTGIVITDSTQLAAPEWGANIDAITGDVAALRARPEFARLSKSAERLDAERGLAGAENRPRVMAFGSAGYGRPGLNQFKPDVASFWQAGVKIEWAPFTWGSAARSRELATLQQRILATEERALGEQLARAVQGDLDDRRRLREQLARDDEVIALRREALAQGSAQQREGAITAAEGVTLRMDLAEAELARVRHRLELAQSEARIATTLGLSPR